MSTAYLGLGSNIDARVNIRSGIAALRSAFGGFALSPIYESPAVGFDGNDFINAVARIETELSPLDLKHWLNELEDRHGRARNVPKFSDRTLDIDILIYDDLWLLSPELEIPRREIMSSAHVLKPLADIAPDLVHPEEGRNMARLWRDFDGASNRLRVIELTEPGNSPGS